MNLNEYSLYHKPIAGRHLDDIKEVFFLTSSKQEFSSDDEKSRFYRRWLGIYLEHYPEQTFYVTFQDKLVAYLVACTNTTHFIKQKADFPHKLNIFEDQYALYPCHLHMNCHPKHQKKGLGKILIHSLFTNLKKQKISGVHLLTSLDRENVYFYRKQGFDKELTAESESTQFHFMGKLL